MICSHCKVRGIGGFIKFSKTLTKSGMHQYYYCNKCNTARLKKYRRTKSGKLNTRKAVSKYNSKNRERTRAWQAVYRHFIKKGLNKPCEICGDIKSDAHHPDICKKLDVIWLCRKHHKERHKTEDVV